MLIVLKNATDCAREASDEMDENVIIRSNKPVVIQ
jgi:hypothetical protein